MIVYNIYGQIQDKTTETLDDLRFAFYKKRVNKTLTSKTGFEVKSLPHPQILPSTIASECIIKSKNSAGMII